MEEYIIKEDTIERINYGDFWDKINLMHCREYGENGAQNIVNNVNKIFTSIKSTIKSGSNHLLVGRVQSGKTANLELLTALAFDNNYNSVVIFGGYDSVLLKQTKERFEKAFNYDHNGNVKVFSTDNKSELLNIDQEIIDTIIKENSGKIIFISMKRPKALNIINRVFRNINTNTISTFIIDDEGDQASLNTEIDNNSSSPTYNEIVMMKHLLKNPLYLSVTATPQALIFSPELSEIRPNNISLIQPGDGYTGADAFHIQEGNIVKIPDVTEDILRDKKMPESLINALYYFLIASAIMKIRGKNYSDMIIHTAKETPIHSIIYSNVEMIINSIKREINIGSHELSIRKEEMKEIYLDKVYFQKSISSLYNFEDLWSNICEVILKTYIILQNNKGKQTMENLQFRKHKLFIGGDLLQRGITFKNLITTYFTRWPKSQGNMDTTLQRARWLGYRSDYKDLCKVFCTKDIAFKYSRLSEIDNDLWDQFESIEKGSLQIEDILIDENDTSLRPARLNVISIKKVGFNRKWNNQKFACYSISELNHNNKLLDNLVKKYELIHSSVGRTDGKKYFWYLIVNKMDFFDLIDNSIYIFDIEPFDKQQIKNAINEEQIILELFFDPTCKEQLRERSFDDNMMISALQQGADTSDINKKHYLGDSHVIVDDTAIIVQVFDILPLINNKKDYSRRQYMYSIHFPTQSQVYSWNK